VFVFTGFAVPLSAVWCKPVSGKLILWFGLVTASAVFIFHCSIALTVVGCISGMKTVGLFSIARTTAHTPQKNPDKKKRIAVMIGMYFMLSPPRFLWRVH
jgi:hypothetical protein